jgi:hypothetical protein
VSNTPPLSAALPDLALPPTMAAFEEAMEKVMNNAPMRAARKNVGVIIASGTQHLWAFCCSAALLF